MRHLGIAVLSISVCIVCGIDAGPAPTSSAFTYQGVLKQNNAPANGSYHLRFQLWDSLSGGVQIGSNFDQPTLNVTDGLFTAELNFGALPFNGEARWLQVQVVVTDGGGTQTVTTLVPRQPVNAAPYALFALASDGSGLTNLNASNLVTGTVAAARMPSGGAWSLGSALNVDSGTFALDPVNDRVGIGTASPLGPLHIAGNAAGLRLQDDDHPASYAVLEDASTGQLRLDKVAGAGGTLIDINPIPLDNTANAHVRFFRHTNTTGSKLVIFHRGNDSTAASAVIGVGGSSSVFQLDGGNVGIGTATPNASNKLEVVNSAPTGTGISAVAASSGMKGVGNVGVEGIGAQTGVQAFASNSSGIGVQGLGNTGVRGDGDTGVRGQGDITGVYGDGNSRGVFGTGPDKGVEAAGGIFDFFASGSGTNYGAVSSIRWKRNLQPIIDPLAMLKQLRGVYYDWDESHGGQHDIGMIAEEVGAVLPEVVAYEANGVDAIGMDYSKLSPLLVEAIKALRAEKDAEIQSLRAENSLLRNRLDALESVITALMKKPGSHQ